MCSHAGYGDVAIHSSHHTCILIHSDLWYNGLKTVCVCVRMCVCVHVYIQCVQVSYTYYTHFVGWVVQTWGCLS